MDIKVLKREEGETMGIMGLEREIRVSSLERGRDWRLGVQREINVLERHRLRVMGLEREWGLGFYIARQIGVKYLEKERDQGMGLQRGGEIRV